MNAIEILQALAERYKNCRSYADTGYVEFDDVKGKRERLEFRTQFERPDYFCFEWQDYGPRRGKSEDFSMLWSLAGETLVRYRWKVERETNLHLAMCGVTGCSAAAVAQVPGLLIHEAPGKKLESMQSLEKLEDQQINGSACWVLNGSCLKPNDTTIYVAQDELTLLALIWTHSETAQESEERHEEMLRNKELIARFAEQGFKYPTNMKHEDRHSVTDYFFNPQFDVPISRQDPPH